MNNWKDSTYLNYRRSRMVYFSLLETDVNFYEWNSYMATPCRIAPACGKASAVVSEMLRSCPKLRSTWWLNFSDEGPLLRWWWAELIITAVIIARCFWWWLSDTKSLRSWRSKVELNDEVPRRDACSLRRVDSRTSAESSCCNAPRLKLMLNFFDVSAGNLLDKWCISAVLLRMSPYAWIA